MTHSEQSLFQGQALGVASRKHLEHRSIISRYLKTQIGSDTRPRVFIALGTSKIKTMTFFAVAAESVGKLVVSLGVKLAGEKVLEVRTQRRMQRLVDDAVDRIVAQMEEYLRTEKVDERRKEILIVSLCDNLRPMTENPQKFFAGDLDGDILFKNSHPDGILPQEIRDEKLGQFYSVLFPQIAHFLAGSRIALNEWQAEGYREEFKRLSQLAEEIRAMNAKVADLPAALVGVIADQLGSDAEVLLRELSQTLLNTLLLRLDLSPLRAERALHGSLGDHFVVPSIRERKKNAKPMSGESLLMARLATPSARRILHGGAGVGKTTCALWLQSCLLQEDPSKLAILLRLRKLPQIEEKSLLEILKEISGPHLRDSLTSDIIKRWHDSGKLALILDGFDEVPEERRDAVEEWIAKLSIVAKRTSIIVTSRPLQSGHLESLGKPWQQWDLLPFDEAKIIEFIQRWHRYLPEVELSATERQIDAETLAKTFFSDPTLKPLADTPLMLGTLLFVHHRDKRLPNGRVDLYERYISAMLGLRDSGLGIEARSTKLTDAEKRRVLSHIALHFHLQSENEIDDATMLSLVGNALQIFNISENTERLLAALCERTGLLQGPGAWSFMHKTIGEFLVCEIICDGNRRLPDGQRLDRSELWRHRHKDGWTAVLYFWAGKTSPRELEEFIEDLLNEKDNPSMLLALSLLGDQGDRLGHDVLRRLALRVCNEPWQSEDQAAMGLCSSGNIPRRFYTSYSAPYSRLRGLSLKYTLEVIIEFFLAGTIAIDDIKWEDSSHLEEITVVTLWLSSKDPGIPMKEILAHLKHLHPHDLSLYCLDSILRNEASNEEISSLIDEWLKLFPFSEDKLSLCLLGALHAPHPKNRGTKFSSSSKKIIGPLLWAKKHLPVNDDWLTESHSWKGWAGELNYDPLLEITKLLDEEDCSYWSLSEEQMNDLRKWCRDLIAKRSSD